MSQFLVPVPVDRQAAFGAIKASQSYVHNDHGQRYSRIHPREAPLPWSQASAIIGNSTAPRMGPSALINFPKPATQYKASASYSPEVIEKLMAPLTHQLPYSFRTAPKVVPDYSTTSPGFLTPMTFMR